jgi:hypothetical protein
MADLTVGTHLHVAGDTAELIVVRAPSETIDLRYGGVPLLGDGDESAEPTPAADGGVLLGKRYVHEASGLELLCVKPGRALLTVSDEVLPVKSAKQLPASD